MPDSIKNPILRSHGNLKSNDGSEVPLHLDPWEIGAQRKNGLTWSIVLSILIPLVDIKVEDFQAVVRIFGINKESTIDNIRKCIRMYNPFLNNSSCYYHPTLKKLVELFEEKVRKRIKQMQAQSKGFSPFLDSACNILQCNIAVICEQHAENCTTALQDPEVLFYLHSPSEPNNYGITIYCKIKRSNRFYKSFSFGLSEAIATMFQENALMKILKPTELVTKDTVANLFRLPDARKNFIIAMIKSYSNKNFINQLYKQLPYTLWQLEQAGFITDPTKTDFDTEKNAFYYALSFMDDPEILYLLYKHSIITTDLNRMPPQAFDVKVINNMSNVARALRKTSDVIQQLDKFPLQKSIFLKELIQLNYYLLSVFKKIQVMLQDDDINEAFKKRNTILAILDAYANQFNVDGFANVENTELVFEKYCTYTNYFKNFDFVSAILFFDNIFSMKKRITLDNGQYEDIESSFVRLIYMCKMYQTDSILHSTNIQQQVEEANCLKKDDDFSNSLKDQLHKDWLSKTCLHEISLENILKLLAYYSRLDFQPKLNSFRENIHSVDLTEAHLRKLDDDDQYRILIYNLETEPLIKEELFLFRLKHYIDLAIKVNLTENTKIGILVILRALQVLGESMHFDVKDQTFTKSLLISVFPKIVETIVGLRNSLIHRKHKHLLRHLRIEKRKDLFKKIQADLKVVRQDLNPIFKLQFLRMNTFICKNSIDLIEKNIDHTEMSAKICDNISQETDNMQESYKEPEELKYIILQQNFKKGLNNCLSELTSKWTKFKNYVAAYFVEHLAWMKNHILDETEIDEVKNRFLVMQKLLKFLVEETEMEKESKKQNLHLPDFALLNFTTEDISKVNLPKIKLDLKVYNHLITEIFPTAQVQNTYSYCQQIKLLFKEINKESYIPPRRKHLMLSGVKRQYYDHHLAIKKIIESLQRKEKLSEIKLNENVQKLKILPKEIKKVKKYYEREDVAGLEKIVDWYGELKESLDTNTFDKIKYEKFNKKTIFEDETLKTINKCLNFQYGELDFFRDRLIQLKKLVIKRDKTTFALWKHGKKPKTRRYLEDRIVSVYMQDPEFQAAVELIIFDCLNLLNDNPRIKKEDRKLLNEFLLKSNRLCKEINLRDLLAHGNPLAEAVMQLLDPGDLFHEMAKELLDLVKDLPVIHAFCQLREDIWNQEGREYLNYDNFQDYFNNKSYTKIVSKIKACKRWQFYSKLLPR